MQGIVGFEHYKIRCVIGVYPSERVRKQDIYVDLRVRTDFSRCVASDELRDAVDYIVLARLCHDLAQARSYKLLETFAEEALTKILLNEEIMWAWIRIRKPKALPGAQCGFIEMERTKC